MTDDRAPDPRIVMYTTAWCGYCHAAKSLLKSKGIAYRDIDVTTDQATRSQAAAATGWRTVPIVLLDGKLVGGFTELAALDSRGGLSELVPSAG